MSRVEYFVVDHRGRVTIWFEGSDPQSDYYNTVSSTSQCRAREYIARDGVGEGCYVQAVNYRDAGVPWPADCRRAKRFAASGGLPYRDQVRFAYRETPEEAEQDRALEPILDTVVVFCGQQWIGGRLMAAYRACARSEIRGAQVIE